MQIPRLFACVATITFWTFAPAQADDWPSQQVNIVVPFSAGGSTDILARVVAQHLQAKLGQPFVVQNKSGAGGGSAVPRWRRPPPTATRS